MSMNEYRFEDCIVGMTESFMVSVDEEALFSFSDITGDVNPLHCDDVYAQKNGFKRRVNYGMLTASYLSTLAGVYLPGKYSLIHTVDIHFSDVVYPGEELCISGTVCEVYSSTKLIDVKVRIRNALNKTVLRGKMRIGFLNG